MQWLLNELDDLAFAQEYHLARSSFQLSGMDMAEWTKFATTVENSTVESSWDTIDLSIVVVDMGRVVNSIVYVQRNRHCVHCFILCHGSRVH